MLLRCDSALAKIVRHNETRKRKEAYSKSSVCLCWCFAALLNEGPKCRIVEVVHMCCAGMSDALGYDEAVRTVSLPPGKVVPDVPGLGVQHDACVERRRIAKRHGVAEDRGPPKYVR
jgi:hypothetical protein